jgi:hypothetical protein
MNMRLSLILGTLALSASAFAQVTVLGNVAGLGIPDVYQIGYAANLNIGDSVVNLSNSGFQGGFFGAVPATSGNICVNAYVFDPQEEEISCCSCLVTPNGLNSLSAKSDLISNNLTPAVPTSIVIKLVASQPGSTTTSGGFTVCNPAVVLGLTANIPYTATLGTATLGAAAGISLTGALAGGLVAWGTTLEPGATPGTFEVVDVDYKTKLLIAPIAAGVALTTTGLAPVGTELSALSSVCNFIQANGTGFGICKSCRLGALGGAKQ